MPTLSTIIITNNSSRTLDACLKPLKDLSSEIIIVDSGSTDNTLEIAKNYTDKVYSMDWPGYGMQKQRALDKATGDWVLSIDSDEVLSSQLCDEIKFAITTDDYQGYYLKHVLAFAGKMIHHCDRDNYHLRLVLRSCARFSNDKVHEHIILKGKAGKLRSPFYHYSYASIENWMHKMNQYTSISVDQKRIKHKKSSISKAVFSSLFTFVKFYFIKRGFMDGRMGFVVAVNWAAGNYYKYLKLAIDDRFDINEAS